jgi:ribonuclease D
MMRRLKMRFDKPRFLALLRELAAWREEEAQRRNLPRNRDQDESLLIELAAHAPQCRRSQPWPRPRAARREQARHGDPGRDRARACGAGSECPKPDPRPVLPAGLGPGGAAEGAAEIQMRGAWGGAAADRQQRRTGSSGGDPADIPRLHGWRREVYGEDALALKAGRIGLTVAGKGIKIIPLPPSS